MSLPRTDEEKGQLARTLTLASTNLNVVSTACPECMTRFAMLARYLENGDWVLRCTRCGWSGKGELKPVTGVP